MNSCGVRGAGCGVRGEIFNKLTLHPAPGNQHLVLFRLGEYLLAFFNSIFNCTDKKES